MAAYVEGFGRRPIEEVRRGAGAVVRKPSGKEPAGDGQQKEGMIGSQLAELGKQVAAAGHELVKEYIDDGYSGSLLDRPGLDQLRADAKSDVFDAIHFLDADRITRDVSYQRIIIAELLKRGKQIIIKGKNYVDLPENKFTVTVLGAVAEFERAKIIERTRRGRLHKLRRGELSSNGHRIYGYDYIRKSPTSPAALVVNDERAAIVRACNPSESRPHFRRRRCAAVPARTSDGRWSWRSSRPATRSAVRGVDDAVDPDNRLVAAELEKRWNERRSIVRNPETELDGLTALPPTELTLADRERLMTLGADLQLAWAKPGVTPETRKQIVRHELRGRPIGAPRRAV
jgi:DNA invertase Pin-like site-specific DNA recombinase